MAVPLNPHASIIQMQLHAEDRASHCVVVDNRNVTLVNHEYIVLLLLPNVIKNITMIDLYKLLKKEI